MENKANQGFFEKVFHLSEHHTDVKTEIIAASIRNLDHVNQVMLAGAQIATIPTNVLEQMLLHPLTDKGLEKFLQDYKNSL